MLIFRNCFRYLDAPSSAGENMVRRGGRRFTPLGNGALSAIEGDHHVQIQQPSLEREILELITDHRLESRAEVRSILDEQVSRQSILVEEALRCCMQAWSLPWEDMEQTWCYTCCFGWAIAWFLPPQSAAWRLRCQWPCGCLRG